jgi:uncharacterized protein (DUF1015 family)
VSRLVREGALHRAPEGSVVVYRMRAGGHVQTGVVAEVSVDDYRAGRIRRHEATDPARVQDLVAYTEQARLEQTPVLLTHPPRPALRTLLAGVTQGEAEIDLAPADGLVHSVWTVQDPATSRAVQAELDAMNTLYIADGHHRMAAAQQYAESRRGFGDANAAAFTLAALFPSDEMRIRPYPRGVRHPEGWSARQVVDALAAAPGAARIEAHTATQPPAPEPGTVAVFLDGWWFGLRLRGTGGGVRDSLDSVRLDEGVLRPVFGQTLDSSAPRAAGAKALEAWCTAHDMVGFLPYPPEMSEVMAISDAEQLMPPKSTWFDPKPVPRLFLRELV